MEKENLELLNKILSSSMKKKIAAQLNNTSNKLKIVDNSSGENKHYPVGYTIEIYNKDDKLVMQWMQS